MEFRRTNATPRISGICFPQVTPDRGVGSRVNAPSRTPVSRIFTAYAPSSSDWSSSFSRSLTLERRPALSSSRRVICRTECSAVVW